MPLISFRAINDMFKRDNGLSDDVFMIITSTYQNTLSMMQITRVSIYFASQLNFPSFFKNFTRIKLSILKKHHNCVELKWKIAVILKSKEILQLYWNQNKISILY